MGTAVSVTKDQHTGGCINLYAPGCVGRFQCWLTLIAVCLRRDGVSFRGRHSAASVAHPPQRSPAAPSTLWRQRQCSIDRRTASGSRHLEARQRGQPIHAAAVNRLLKSHYNASLVQLIPCGRGGGESSGGRIHGERWNVSKSLPESLFFGTRGKRKLIKKTTIKQTLVRAFYVLLPPKNDFLQL